MALKPVSQESFSVRAERFVLSLKVPDEIRDTVRKEIVKFVLGIQNKMGSTVLRSMAYKNNFEHEFLAFKNHYLDYSFDIHRVLWKAMADFIHRNQKNQYESVNDDVKYCLSQLGDDDITRLKRIDINPDLDVDSIDLNTMKIGKKNKKSLMAYANTKLNPLKFISKYDFGIDKEDLQQELLCEVVRVSNYYGKSAASKLKVETDQNVKLEDRLQKYIETSLNNKVLNLKEYHSCESRRRANTTDSKSYRLRARLKKQLSLNPTDTSVIDKLKEVEDKLRTSNSDYYSTVTPLVRGTESDERELDAQEINENALIPLHYTMGDTEDKLWVNELVQDLPAKISKFVQLLLVEQSDTEFERWYTNWSKGKKYSDSFDCQVKGIMEYCNVTKNELRKNPVLLNAISRKKCGTWDHIKKSDKVDIFVQNTNTKQIYGASIIDSRDDGSYIFSVDDPKYRSTELDTMHDYNWKVVAHSNR